ncbi:hypothetical protein LAG90_03280 [Marinilongibacter aquaticus]|uniref:hypothetical protein n=1 Tax=Marinilongibacter aquaticus TaxID=2975157 RepID=UPI0021BDE9B9|nr:hypothetical protein [Marinilongibacter aquaticus]UBM59671.1 hypothetical protein LAG90_03280 [Marinilongibacter aquaticus]
MKKLLLIVPFVALLSSCEKDDPVIPNEEEVITTLIYTLTPDSGAGDTVELKFYDADGDGGIAPVLTSSGPIKANTVYNGALRLLNEIEDPAEETTDEIREESEDHQFFFKFDGLDATAVAVDADDNGNPIGLSSKFTAGAASSGQLTITLRHQPDKFGQGVSDGEIANAGGETDIEVTFDVVIEE